jgi:hypothetical protein
MYLIGFVSSQARDLDAVLNGTRSVSQNALNAANAYKNIDATIQQAEEEARSAKASSEDALEVVSNIWKTQIWTLHNWPLWTSGPKGGSRSPVSSCLPIEETEDGYYWQEAESLQ